MNRRGTDEFYVGYQREAPAALARATRGRVILLLVVSAAVAGLITAFQGPFGNGVFEYGQVGSFEGLIREYPYPTLLVQEPVPNGRVAGFTRWSLVGTGKFGAGEAVKGLDGRRVALRGTLIYRDGQKMIEVVAGSVRPLGVGEVVSPPGKPVPYGPHTLRGEIVDSKCYLGVMNPGNLKTHKSCAIRCISGGIPPVLLVRDSQGQAVYLFLVDAEGRPVNEAVLGMVAEPVEVYGEVERRQNLLYLKADPKTYTRL